MVVTENIKTIAAYSRYMIIPNIDPMITPVVRLIMIV